MSSNNTPIIEHVTRRHGIREFIDELHVGISGSKAETIERAVKKFGIPPVKRFS